MYTTISTTIFKRYELWKVCQYKFFKNTKYINVYQIKNNNLLNHLSLSYLFLHKIYIKGETLQKKKTFKFFLSKLGKKNLYNMKNINVPLIKIYKIYKKGYIV